jgi:hypothetical protein
MIIIEVNPNRIRRLKVTKILGDLLLKKNHYSNNGRYLAESEFKLYFAPSDVPKSQPVNTEEKDISLVELSGLAPYVNDDNKYIESIKQAESDLLVQKEMEKEHVKRKRSPRKPKD